MILNKELKAEFKLKSFKINSKVVCKKFLLMSLTLETKTFLNKDWLFFILIEWVCLTKVVFRA